MSNRITETEYAHYALTYTNIKASLPLPTSKTPREVVLAAIAANDSGSWLENIVNVSCRLEEMLPSSKAADSDKVKELSSSMEAFVLKVVANAIQPDANPDLVGRALVAPMVKELTRLFKKAANEQ